MLARFATRPPDVPVRRVAPHQTLRPATLGLAACAALVGCARRRARRRGTAGAGSERALDAAPLRQPTAAMAAAPPELAPDLAGGSHSSSSRTSSTSALRKQYRNECGMGGRPLGSRDVRRGQRQYYPSITLNGTGTGDPPDRGVGGAAAVDQKFYGPSVTGLRGCFSISGADRAESAWHVGAARGGLDP